jgi:hypothetical protein
MRRIGASCKASAIAPASGSFRRIAMIADESTII